MSREFENKWAVILGGSSGLGLASAIKLASHGMNICVVHRDRRSDLAQIEKNWELIRSQHVEFKTINTDALKLDSRQKVLDEIGSNQVYLLLHSLAKGNLKPLKGDRDQRLSSQDLSLTTNAMGGSLLDWAQELISSDKFSNPARIIAFTSEGNQRTWPAYGAVSAAKGVLEALIRQMAVEYAGLGISTNAIQAGVTLTPSFQMIPNNEKMAYMAEKRNPFGRLTTPQDIAKVVYLLSRPEADWINGAIIKADGGESLR
ncbi:SDR family oxidoreductase [Aureitalea marina]|uniref:Short-chain dehydrogenase n=1 Tax=Aureitalea marina TaxID=930804 RepID=A0A2S7KP40_9FLAO|nr:SDR family oxidoreductase [Aureitalea marina]PQB04385.1 short-chain dehydrogenase [Aureitalea marina]